MKTSLVLSKWAAGIVLGLLISQPVSAQVTQPFMSGGMDATTGLTSGGVAWTPGAYFFELGVFDASFDPSAGNISSWSSSWTVASNGLNTGVGSWLDDEGLQYFSGSGGYSTNDAPFAAGARLYVWGYNTKATADAGAEWILLTNSSWTVASTGMPAALAALDTTDVGTVALFGSISDGGYSLQSASVAASLVPEPAAFAVFAGLAGMAWVAAKRRRR